MMIWKRSDLDRTTVGQSLDGSNHPSCPNQAAQQQSDWLSARSIEGNADNFQLNWPTPANIWFCLSEHRSKGLVNLMETRDVTHRVTKRHNSTDPKALQAEVSVWDPGFCKHNTPHFPGKYLYNDCQPDSCMRPIIELAPNKK